MSMLRKPRKQENTKAR